MSEAVNPFGPKSGLPLVETNLGDLQKETKNQTSATPNQSTNPSADSTNSQQKSDESKSHDPSSAILEANVKFNKAVSELAAGTQAVESKPPVVSLSKSIAIRRILAEGGMDSQQVGKALNQILEVVQK